MVQSGDFPVLDSSGKWTGEWQRERIKRSAPFSKGYGTLARDLQPRTLADIYRENRAGRVVLNGKYVPCHDTGYSIKGGIFGERRIPFASMAKAYEAWCKKRKHKPHPASLDPEHPINRWRLRCPPRQTAD